MLGGARGAEDEEPHAGVARVTGSLGGSKWLVTRIRMQAVSGLVESSAVPAAGEGVRAETSAESLESSVADSEAPEGLEPVGELEA